MTVLGHSRHFESAPATSALHPTSDIATRAGSRGATPTPPGVRLQNGVGAVGRDHQLTVDFLLARRRRMRRIGWKKDGVAL
jgi:hypothetical protein